MTDRPIIFSAPMVRALLAGRKTQTRRPEKSPLRRCKPGDRLWVREAWQSDVRNFGLPPHDISRKEPIWFAAGGDPVQASFVSVCATGWRSSIHMPRWASRLTLIVTDVRWQRLQDISEDDAQAEGVDPIAGQPDPPGAHRMAFREVWDAIYGLGHDQWSRNRVVRYLTFTVEHRNIDAASP